ncbi:MAG TPA: winged helix DNA-binding domain-containing protein [Streptosporangiaceae bacterium]|nr:winged helix DNA-binding domain-containing protein [Streptosporangiaceae bacterium]
MTITAKALNRATLGRQLLLEREELGVDEAMARVVALQAQHAASPYLALWNRLAGFSPAELDAGFAGYSLVKAKLMRVTLHAVYAGDYVAFREAMDPTLRAARLGDKRFRISGLTAGDADVLIAELLGYADKPRTGPACEAWLSERLGEPAAKAAWWGLKQYAPLWHAPGTAPWTFGTRASYVAAVPRPVLADPDTCAEALKILIRRYLEGFGPASVQDMALFAMAHMPRVRAAVQAMAGELVQLDGPGGAVLYDVPGGSWPAEDTPAPPRLLGMWDSVLLAHRDRDRIIPPEYRKQVTRTNGDVLPAVLVDGYVAGVWRAVGGGVEVTAFRPLDGETWAGLAVEAQSLVAFLADRDPRVYSYYNHWWVKRIPGEEVRTLPAEAY